MKTITRHHAIEMYRQLGVMALGHLDEVTLSATLDNFDKFRNIQEDLQKLAQELSKRLYEGKDEKAKEEFFKLIAILESENDAEKRAEIESQMKQYAEFFELYAKQLKVMTQLLFKKVEADITEVDKDAFIAGVVKGKKDAKVHEIVAFFAPMFKEEEKKDSDFSELDELLK